MNPQSIVGILKWQEGTDSSLNKFKLLDLDCFLEKCVGLVTVECM